MNYLDFIDVPGHEHAKRAIEVAITGAHSIALVGPQGSGKRLLVQAIESILPDTGMPAIWDKYIDLFHPALSVQKAIRQGIIIGIADPCPCGYFGNTEYECTCGNLEDYTKNLQKNLSLFQIHIKLDLLSIEKVQSTRPGESSERVKERIQVALEYARNNQLSNELDQTDQNLLKAAYSTVMKSNINIYRSTIAIARTIADLEQSEEIRSHHLAESIQYCYRRKNYEIK